MMDLNQPLVTIIIVTYNSEDEIVGCLDSIFKNNVESLVYIVDNNSSDNTKQLIQNYATRQPKVRLIINEDNKGLAAANNQPLPYIDTKYTMILNPDILLREDSLSIMIKGMESDPGIGMLGPLCVFEGGEPHVSAHSHYNIFTILTWRVLPHTVMRYFFDKFSDFRKKDVLFVSGACYMIQSKLYKELNGYDNELFLTVSDVADIGVRIRKKGYKATYYPEAVITHFSGRSNAPLKFLTQFWGLTGDLYFLKKHKGAFQQATAKSIFIISSLIRAILFTVASWLKRNVAYREKAKLYFDLTKSLWAFNPPPVKEF